MKINNKEKIDLHKRFWNNEKINTPLVSFRIGDFFWSSHFDAARNLLNDGKKITPDMLEVDDFLPDYERMYQEISSLGQSGFWVAEPFNGIPWMEAILGCDVYATENSFISKPAVNSLSELEIQLNEDNEWFKKFVEFLEKLQNISKGRFPVGQPILRGPSDMMGALLGQTEMVIALVENPELMKKLFAQVTGVFLKVVEKQYQIISDFYDGYAIGFYHLWTPGKSIWYQEDLSALLSPEYYKTFLKESNRQICSEYCYNLIHLHPSSFFILDELMDIDELKVIQINKDIEGPSVEEMMPQFKKVIKGKKLVIWGDLNKEELELIFKEIPLDKLYLNIVSESLATAKDLMSYIESYFKL